MKAALINCSLALLFAAVFMGAGSLTAAIDAATKGEEKVNTFQRYAETECRRPDAVTEYRVFVEWCSSRSECYRSCSIEPRDREEGPARTMKRLLDRKNT